MTLSPSDPVATLLGDDLSRGRDLWSLAETWAGSRSGEDALVYLSDASSASAMRSLTWEQLVTITWDLRQRLAGAGVTDQRVVATALPNSLLSVALWLAVPANGAVIQALDPASGSLVFSRALAATRPVLVVASSANAAMLASVIRETCIDSALVVLDDLELTGAYREAARLQALAAPTVASPEQVAGILPTSGTSGTPKWVQLTHRNYVMGAERLARNSGFLTSDRHYLCSPMFHTNAQVYLCAPAFITGGSVAIVPQFSASRYFDAARRTGATVSSMVAPPLRMALRRAIERGGHVDDGGLRLIQYGMSLSQADWEDWDRLLPGIGMRQIYGQTESVTGVLGGSPWEPDDRQTIGRPFVGVDAVRLVDSDGEDVPDGAPGELWVKGTPGCTVMLGYYHAPEKTQAVLVDGTWLRTGDIMVRHSTGRFEFRGRNMHIIRRGGENLSTYALELDLQSCPLVRDVAVTAEDDSTLDAVIVAHVIPGDGYDEAAFLRWCAKHVGKRGMPDHVRVHDRFPRTGSGRVIVRELG